MSPDIDSKMKEANANFESEEYKKAIDCYDDILKIDPDHLDAYFFKGNAYFNLGDFDKAIKSYNELLKLNHQDLDALNWKGKALYEINEFEDAINQFNEVLNIYPGDIFALSGKIYSLIALNNLKESLKYLEKLLKIIPEDEKIGHVKEYADACFELGNVLKHLNKKDESLKAYENFVDTVRKNKIKDLYVKARRVSGYLNWAKKSGENVTFSPREEPQYWQWVTNPEYFLEEDGSERKCLEPEFMEDPGEWWTCHKDTLFGDLIFIYRAGTENGVTYRDIKYVVMARSDAYPLDSIETSGKDNWRYGCDYIPLFKFKNSLMIEEIRADPYLNEWNALRKNFQGVVFRTEESIWKHINDALLSKNKDYETFFKTFDRGDIMAKIIDELAVENKLSDNFHIMKNFGYDLDFDSRQKPCLGDGGFIDILSKDKKSGEYVVIELKVVKADRCAFGQLSSYMGWVMENLANGKPVKGIVISRGFDTKFRSALQTNPQIEHIELTELLQKLNMKLK
jgi:hypothetical protein